MEIRTYQQEVRRWAVNCFGEEIANDKVERYYRFIEEALELVQSLGMSKEEVLILVDYTFNRPIGEKEQEVGGVMTTLASLCAANSMDLEDCSFDELERVWRKIGKIREKQKTKPKNSPLPEHEESIKP